MIVRYSESAIAILLSMNLAIAAPSRNEEVRLNPGFPSKAQSSPDPSAKKVSGLSTRATRPGSAALTERQRALHALNRLTFGPRPGDVQAVMARGVETWIDDQLHPESIDDSALDAHLAPYLTTRMNPKQLAQMFPSDNVIRQTIAGKRQMPTDPLQELVYSVNVARIEQQNANKTTVTRNMGNLPAGTRSSSDADHTEDRPSDTKLLSPEDQARSIAESLLALPKDRRLAALENVPPEQLVNFPNQVRADQRDRLAADFSPQEREILRALANPAGVVAYELQQAKLIREIYSERQLLEVMTDFWLNHFNVYQFKDQCAYYTTAYERDVIRPHALGKFYNLLVDTAQSPAMLVYLDNWLSMGPHSPAAGKNGQSGLNENYGREVMELHTLGVDSGYTQSDVTELSRVLTGWTIAQPDDGGLFQFDARRHEPGTKTVLGQKFFEAGTDEGLHALDMLAHHPATAHFISKSIAVRFVSDDPPDSLVTRMAATFQSSDGDIREVLRTMFRSPEFWSPKVYRTKLKTPLEFIVSAVRASSANVIAPDALLQNLNTMGMPAYGMAVPSGYSMKAETWQNQGALLARVNFSTLLTQGKFPGVQFDPGDLVTIAILTNVGASAAKSGSSDKDTGLDSAMAIIEEAILHGELSPDQQDIVRKQVHQPDVQRQMTTSSLDVLRLVVGFSLASPEFQRR